MKIDVEKYPSWEIEDPEGWPKKVPILRREDFCRGVLHKRRENGEMAHCFLGHARTLFPGMAPHDKSGYRRLDLLMCLKDTAVKMGLKVSDSGDIVPCDHLDQPFRVNDCTANSKRDLAKCWNITMHRLGYTEIFEEE